LREVSRDRLESVRGDDLLIEQGKVLVLKQLLDLPERAQTVLDGRIRQ
jgi:hypothetical protein